MLNHFNEIWELRFFQLEQDTQFPAPVFKNKGARDSHRYGKILKAKQNWKNNNQASHSIV